MTDTDSAATDTGEAGSTTTNNSGPESNVAIQAGQVHNSSVYQVLPGDPPHKKYADGVRYLNNGRRQRARELIDIAINEGHDGAEVRVHWVLALLSKRSYRDLAREDRDQIEKLCVVAGDYAKDGWGKTLQAICGLLECQQGTATDPSFALHELQTAPRSQREPIFHHLRYVLEGGQMDSVWLKLWKDARANQFARNRSGRIWVYFEPTPAEPRARHPAENATTGEDLWWAIGASTLFLVAVGYLGWSVLSRPSPVPIAAYVCALAAAVVGARYGVEWRYRVERFAVKAGEYHRLRKGPPDNSTGFAGQVYRGFEHYFGKYRPRGIDRERWLNRTSGIRETLYREIVEIYRESRTKSWEIKWLIRYLARDIAHAGVSGNIQKYRERYRVATATKVWCSVALAVLVPAAIGTLVAAVRNTPVGSVPAILAMLVGGRISLVRWWRMISERRRVLDEQRDYDDNLQGRRKEHQRWETKLIRLCPIEHEMERWLECDKTIFLGEVLRHYGLPWRDIIADTFLQTPPPSATHAYDRARSWDGAWRYSKYDLRVFLVTQDGVREVATKLDFAHGKFNGKERNHFRFDAVSSIWVTEGDDDTYQLGLTLTNGPTRNINIVDAEANQAGPDVEEPPAGFSQMNLEMTGFAHTLHILEGVAAEGKGWIERDIRPPPSTCAAST